MNTKIALLFILFLLAGINTHAQEKAVTDDLPSVQSVLEKYVVALGGKEKLESITSRVMQGNYGIPTKNYSTTAEMYFKAPGKFRLSFTGKKNTAARGFADSVGWSRDWSEEGLRILTGPELLADKREADFYREIHLLQLYPKMKITGTAMVDEHKAYVLEAIPAEGSTEIMYFDVETGLLLRRDVNQYLSIHNVELHFLDYREVEGIHIPFTIQIIRPVAPFMNTFTFTRVLLNKHIDDEVFAAPSKN